MITPLEDRIILKQEKVVEEQTSFGLILTNASEENSNKAKVIAVGPGRVLPNGVQLEMDVKVGNTVVFSPLAVQYFDYETEEYMVIFSKDILAVIEE